MLGGRIMEELKVSQPGAELRTKGSADASDRCCRVRRYVLFYNPPDRSLKLNALSAKRTDGQRKGGTIWNSPDRSQGSISSIVERARVFFVNLR